MAEARNEKIRHMDELHDAQKKCADLEGRLVDMSPMIYFFFIFCENLNCLFV